MDLQTYTNWKGYNTFYLKPSMISKILHQSKNIKDFKRQCNSITRLEKYRMSLEKEWELYFETV